MTDHPAAAAAPRGRRRALVIAGYIGVILVIALVVTAVRGGGSDSEAAKPDAPSAPKSTSTVPVIDTVKADGSVLDVLDGLDGADRFASIVETLPKTVFLQERGITLLVPPDSAITQAQAAKLRKDANAASVFVSQHLIVGRESMKDLAPKVTTSDGSKRKVDAKKPSIDGVKVTKSDIEATNGYIQLLAGALK